MTPQNNQFMNAMNQKASTSGQGLSQAVTDAVNIALSQNGFRNNTEVVLEIDGREFGRAVVEQGNAENRRVGTRLVIA